MAFQLLAPSIAVAASALLSVTGACTILSSTGEAPGGKNPHTGGVFGTRGSGGGNNNNGTGNNNGNGGNNNSGASNSAVAVAPNGPRVSNWTDFVPREPMWFINAGSGNYNSQYHTEDNSKGLHNWWRGPNAVPNLVNKIEEGYQAGARWFFVNRPMGADAASHVTGAGWLTIDAKKREAMTDQLNAMLLDRFDEPVHIVWFIGSDMSDPRSMRGWTSSRDAENFQIGQTNTWKQIVSSRATLGGLIASGASGFAIDHSAPAEEREHFINMFHQLIRPPFGLIVMGEAFPVKWELGRYPDGSPPLDMDAMRAMPWVATEALLKEWWPTTFRPGVDSIDPDSTRGYVWMSWATVTYGTPDQRKDRIRGWLERGLIPITMDAVMFREAQEYLRDN